MNTEHGINKEKRYPWVQIRASSPSPIHIERQQRHTRARGVSFQYNAIRKTHCARILRQTHL